MCVMRLGRMRVILCLVHMYVILLIHNKILSSISIDRLPKPWGDTTYSCVWDDLCASVYFMNHLYIWHHVFTKRNDLLDRSIHLQSLPLIWLIHVCDINAWLCMYATLLMHKIKIDESCTKTNIVPHRWIDFQCLQETWRIYVREVTCAYVWHDPLIHVSLLSHKNNYCFRSLCRLTGDKDP